MPISTNKAPNVSKNSKLVFKNLGANVSESIYYDFTKNVKILSDTTHRLVEAEKHKFRDICFAVLKALIWTTVVAAGILSTIKLYTLSGIQLALK